MTCLELYEGVQSQPDSLLESRKAWQKGIARAPRYDFYCITNLLKVSIPTTPGFEPDSWVSIPRVRTRLLGFDPRVRTRLLVARGFDPGIPSDPEYRPQGVDPKGCGAEAPSSGVDPTEFWVLDP